MLHLTIYLENYWEAQDDELNYVDYKSHFKTHPCNIYIIGSKPRVSIDPEYLNQSLNEVKLLYKIQEGFSFKEVYGTIQLDREIIGDLKIESEFPHSRFNLKDDKGYFLLDSEYQNIKDRKIKASYSLRASKTSLDKNLINDFKILYIGQSTKMDKKISPAIRLKKHHHLQNILSRCTTKYIDKEIYIILCSFIGRVDLRATDKQLREVGDIKDIFAKIAKDSAVLNSDTKFITNVSEASLIDYFEPEFNSDFIGTFGRKNHSYYNQIMKAKLESISVEIDLNELCRIYSDEIDSHKHHGINYIPKEDFTRTNFHHDIENGI